MKSHLFAASAALTLLTGTAVGSADAAQAKFTVNSVTANVTTVAPGQTINFSTSVTATQAASGYIIGLQVYNTKTNVQTSNTWAQNISFQANKAVTETGQWTV